MFKVLLLIVIGIAIGYFLGFNDAQKHDINIVQRVVNRAGGAARNSVSNDIDAKMEKAGGGR
jgi:hypothetical protein